MTERRKPVFLIGYMGAGKSTVAPLLARKTGGEWVDTDDLVEEKAGLQIKEIFARQGEEKFRLLETGALREAIREGADVIAVGGGAPMGDRNWRLMKRNGLTCYLRLKPREVLSRVSGDGEERPLLAGLGEEERLEKIEKMLERREPRYLQADFVLESGGLSPEEVAEKIYERL